MTRSSATSARPSVLAVLAEIGGAILGGVILAVICGYSVGFILLQVRPDLGMGCDVTFCMTVSPYRGGCG